MNARKAYLKSMYLYGSINRYKTEGATTNLPFVAEAAGVHFLRNSFVHEAADFFFIFDVD